MVFSTASIRPASSVQGMAGGSSAAFGGRKESSSRTAWSVASSVSNAKWATPERVAWARAPPSSSLVTSSCVTARITSGPFRNIEEAPFTMKTKSVMAGP